MLLDNKCTMVPSVEVKLTFDDGSVKVRVIGTGDLIYVVYNGNGIRKTAEGRVLKVSAAGIDPKGWYIIVDASDDFNSNQAKFSPTSILDCEIIRKADTLDAVKTVLGEEAVPYIRIVDGRLQYSKDGQTWKSINIDSRDIIEDQEGTVTETNSTTDDNTDDIDEAIY